MDNLSILDVDPPNLSKVSIISPILSDELSDNSEWLGRVNREVAAGSEEVFIAITIRVVIAAVLIAGALISLA